MEEKIRNLYDLPKEEIWFLLKCYNDYIVDLDDDETDRVPVCIQEFYNNEYKEYYQYYLDLLWEDLAYIPVDDNMNIEEDFYIWGKGTNCIDTIWHWFDERVEGGIGNKYFN